MMPTGFLDKSGIFFLDFTVENRATWVSMICFVRVNRQNILLNKYPVSGTVENDAVKVSMLRLYLLVRCWQCFPLTAELDPVAEKKVFPLLFLTNQSFAFFNSKASNTCCSVVCFLKDCLLVSFFLKFNCSTNILSALKNWKYFFNH
jgi:hypothetical protein